MSDLITSYRPKTFDDIVGHEQIVQALDALLNRGFPHAVLFTGPSGCGKTTFVRAIANELDAELLEVDAASYSGVKDMREIVAPLRYHTISGKPQMVVIDECHALSAQAWQALLKPIEEPISSVYFGLCSTEERKIPKTIKTRCVKFNVGKIYDPDMLTLLNRICREEGDGPCLEVVDACVVSAGGSPRQGIVNLQACWSCATYDEAIRMCEEIASESEVIELCRTLVKGDLDACLKVVNSLPNNINPEGVRIQVLLYMAKVVLNGSIRKGIPIMEAFETSFMEAEKKAPLVLACYRACEYD